MTDPYILVVDDEPDIRNLVQEILEDEGYSVSVAENGRFAREAIEEQTPQLVLLDIWMPDEDGISLLKDLKASGKLRFPVVMISGHGTVETAVEATRHGAVDFVEKPLSLAKLLLTVEKALHRGQQQTVMSGDENQQALPPLIGNSRYVNQIKSSVAELASRPHNILIRGEPATGKNLVARHIHVASQRQGQFIVLRCDSLSTANSPRELLGDESHGPFNNGYLESANGGTLYLKDVEQLPVAAQAILLDAITKRELKRGGALGRQALDIRFMVSTSADLAQLVKHGDFRSDLYAAFSEAEIACLPLREHPEDLPQLLESFVNSFVAEEGLPYRHFTVAAQNRLRNLPWPGNLLELKNFVQRVMILGSGVEIDVDEVQSILGGAASRDGSEPVSLSEISLEQPLREARAAFERVYMLHQLQLAEGNIGELAKRVGMERTHLYRKLRSLEIDLGKVRD